MSKKQKLLSAISKVKDKTIDVTSDVLSAPKRLKEGFKEAQANAKADSMLARKQSRQLAEESKGVSIRGKGANDEVLRARLNAINEVFDREEEKRK